MILKGYNRMTRTLSYTITEGDSGCKLGDFLRKKGYSRHILTHLKRTDHGICVNGDWAYTSQTLQTGDVVTVFLAEESASEHIVPVPLPFPILYEDEDLMIINKPADMPIHPSINNFENTLANAAAWYFANRGETFVYRCINRLDRDTTGLLILAKNMLSGALLSQMSAKRQIHRQYLAIAQGCVPKEGMIDAPIARKPDSVIERCVDFEKGERAVTHYRRLCFDGTCSLVLLKLETGRTHQIRVHMKHIGHPLPGDYLYNPDFSRIKRQALHSYRLAFNHPISGKPMEFTAPIPQDFKKFACGCAEPHQYEDNG